MDNKVMQFMKFCLCSIVLQLFHPVTGQQYILSGSSKFAALGEAFTWTCDFLLPPVENKYGVIFYKDKSACYGVSTINQTCVGQQSSCPVYEYNCLSKTKYTLTIPAEKLTIQEQGSTWKCENGVPDYPSYTSPPVILNIAIDVQNVTILPSVNPVTVIEGKWTELKCAVNDDALPAPNITWYLGSTVFDSASGAYSSYINFTVDRESQSTTIVCSATNNNKESKTANKGLIVEYPPTVIKLSKQDIIEGRELNVTCQAKPGNPSNIIFSWTKEDNPGFRQNRATLQLPNIARNSSGIYKCTAENNYSNGQMGTHSQLMDVFVLYPPTVTFLPQQDIVEGRDLSVTCQATPGYPNITIFFWTNKDNTRFRQNGSTLQISRIQKTSSGTYLCTAQNMYNNKENGKHSEPMVINVLYPPTVKSMSQQDINEGNNKSVTCQATPGNPNFTTFYWNKVDDSGFRQNGTTLHFFNIQRNDTGTYRCTAENYLGNGEKGTDNRTMVVNVLYRPTIESKSLHLVNESETVAVTRHISSNPLSTALWYYNTVLLKEETSVETATFIIENATCTDTKNFTLLARNGIGNDTDLVELIVNCKPRSYKTNFTLGVTDTTGIDFSTFVIAYPEPLIELVNKNGTVPDQMMKSISRNAVNNFTIHISQAVVNQSDFGVYHLKVRNLYGEITVIVNVIPRRKPNMPDNIKIVCEETRANVQWKSSFNGGDPQLFTVFASSGQQSDKIPDRGENVIHSTFVPHLQPSTMYVFYVSAQNGHGIISSENISCTTLAESSEKLPIIVGSAAAGGLTLAIVVIVVAFLFRRYKSTEDQAGKSQRFENDLVENESVDDDGLKDNILYVSADSRENEKHEVAVYTVVNKKDPTSNNNSNVYAEVKKNGIKGVKEGAIYSDVKPKKGFFKKDGKVKKEKRQKRKQEVADVYENSDNIAMTANPDNVYSNTNHNNDSAKEQRGYKNKDGLLYVEVQFDTKAEQRNPVIHGDDEKTDYATVEFPVPSSSHDRE